MPRKLLSLVILILIPLSVWGGGSRVGNGSSSALVLGADEDYQILVPQNFEPTQKLQNGMRLSGPQSVKVLPFGPLGLGRVESKPQTLDINDLSTEIPEFGKMPKSEIQKWFQDKGDHPMDSDSRCVLAQSVKKNGLITAVVTWSNGKGYAASVESTEVGQRGIEELAKSTKVLKGECEWK
jgi:hypothetical protein